MCRQQFLPLLVLALVLSAVQPRPSHAGWQVDGALVSGANSNQRHCTVAPDGVGGAIITWVDNRNGNHDIYAQRVDAAGIRWSIPQERAGERFQLALFDVGGRKVATVAEGAAQAGAHAGRLRPQETASLTNGVYFLRLQLGSQRLTRPMIVAR